MAALPIDGDAAEDSHALAGDGWVDEEAGLVAEQRVVFVEQVLDAGEEFDVVVDPVAAVEANSRK